ncbi:peptidase inhibitor family I36 protein [Plantactinospora soyae]|uniref:Peptidase inhibitor family I36 n=1 Tax=Plantactinospora soyae TaxID=1544732 RepID=A0A927M450_9ACTN|nr:peptidase inhibitor family I36 protein [Plantactinospora soyae]MBE1487659.1 hypothetical protein [Plantactinospora soyae]
MRTAVRRTLATAAAVALGGAATMVGPQPASAGTPDCPRYNICLYLERNYEGDRMDYHESDMYECLYGYVPQGLASSVHNNTRFAFRLWDSNAGLNWAVVGTAAPYKAYGSFGAGDNRVSIIASPGCTPFD